jgi:hypothetical protein
MKQTLLLFSLFLCFSHMRSSAQANCPSFNTPPSDLCGGTCIYCDISGVTSTTAGYTGQAPAGFCGSIESEQWLGFIAQTQSTTVVVTPSNCADNNGLQIAMYKDCSGTPLGCNGGAGGQGMTPVSTTVLTIPGEVYYVMIDGWAGDQCDFSFFVVPQQGTSGQVNFDGSIAGPDQVCPLSTMNYTFADLSNVNLFYWQGPQGMLVNGFEVPVTLPGSASGNFDITFPLFADSMSFSAIPANDCIDSTGSNAMIKTVYEQIAPMVTLPDTIVTSLVYIAPWGQVITMSGIYSGALDVPVGCDIILSQTVTFSTSNTQEIGLTRLALKPNPFRSEVVIQLDQDDTPGGILILDLYDAFGKLCDTKTFTGSTLTYRNEELVSGVYLLKIASRDHQNFIATGKLIKL